MNNTENRYTETDLGNVAPNPRGEYDSAEAYEYLDLVEYGGGSYLCVQEAGTVTGIAPAQGKNTEVWQVLTIPGDLTPEYIAMHDDVVNKAESAQADAASTAADRELVESMMANVEQLQTQTETAAQEASDSRDSAAGYAAAAEASRTAAAESEKNAQLQVTGFDGTVNAAKQEATEEIATARKTAVQAVAARQVKSVNAVNAAGSAAIEKTSADAKEAKDAKAEAVSAANAAVDSAREATAAAEQAKNDKQSAETAAAAAKTSAAAAETAQKAVEGAAGQIETNTAGIEALKEDTAALSSKLEKNEKRAERAEATAQYAIKMQQGYTYDCKTVVGSGSEINVPVGAKDYAGIRKIGGMSRKGYQMLQDDFPASSSQLSITKNAHYNYTLTTVTEGVYRQGNIDQSVSGLAGMYTIHAKIVGEGGLIVRFFSANKQEKLAECTITSTMPEKTISVPNDFAAITLVFLGNTSVIIPIGSVTTISSIMLEPGNTAHRFEPYTADLITATVDSVVSRRGGGEVIHTTALPPEMLALCPDYGQGTDESYNYIDFEAKSYHHVGSMTQNGVWAALDTPEIINLSAAWPDDLELITVASGGTVQMHYPKLDNEFEVAVPSEIVFLIDIAKVIKE